MTMVRSNLSYYKKSLENLISGTGSVSKCTGKLASGRKKTSRMVTTHIPSKKITAEALNLTLAMSENS